MLVGPNMLDRNPDYKAKDSRNNVVFTDSTDSSISGLHINAVRKPDSALVLRRCRRFRLSNITILDSDGRALVLEETTDVIAAPELQSAK